MLLFAVIISVNHNKYKIMNVTWKYNYKNIGCFLLEFQQAMIYSRTNVYEADVISVSLASVYYF